MARPVPLLSAYSPRQFSLVRVGLGLYLASHFAGLIPSARDLYGPAGMFPPDRAAPFPSVLGILVSEGSLVGFFIVLIGLALIYAAGIERRASAVLLWYGLTCLVSRSPHLLLPHDGYVGWLLLATALVPGREPFRVGRGGGDFRMPAMIYGGAWTIVALAYSVSGIFKLASPSWRSGEALRFVLECPFARLGWPRSALLAAPDWLLHGATWGALALELFFVPMCLNRSTRQAAWAAMVAMHLVTLLVLDIASVSVAMLLVHLFIVEAAWLPRVLPTNFLKFGTKARGEPRADP
jgi:hypothetical protein